MKISYAIPVKNENVELGKLMDVLNHHIRKDDEIVILIDANTPEETYKKLSKAWWLSTSIHTHVRKFDGDFAKHKNHLASLCTGDWIYQIDSDELPSPEFIQALPELLEMNPEVDMYEVPRINTIVGIPDNANFGEIARSWNWNVDAKGRVNFPDYQCRIYRNNGKIKWQNPVHERLVGYETQAHLPTDGEYCLLHEKQFNRQFSQNAHYNRLNVMNYLKQTGNHYGSKEVEFNGVKYHKWLHPYQGSWEEEHLFTDKELSNIKKMIGNGIVLDIGAQAGYMSVAYAHCGAYEVIAFEPNPAAYEVLEAQASIHPKIKPFNYAVTDRYVHTQFHYSDPGLCNGGYASVLDAGVGVTGHSLPIPVYGIPCEGVEATYRFSSAPVTFIKVDAEGHDMVILDEIRPIIDRWKPIIQTEIYDGLSENEKRKLLDTIHSLGYIAYNMADSSDIDNLGEPVTDASTLELNSGHNLICLPTLKMQ